MEWMVLNGENLINQQKRRHIMLLFLIKSRDFAQLAKPDVYRLM